MQVVYSSAWRNVAVRRWRVVARANEVPHTVMILDGVWCGMQSKIRAYKLRTIAENLNYGCVHCVESNEAVQGFWISGQKTLLKRYVCSEINPFT